MKDWKDYAKVGDIHAATITLSEKIKDKTSCDAMVRGFHLGYLAGEGDRIAHEIDSLTETNEKLKEILNEDWRPE